MKHQRHEDIKPEKLVWLVPAKLTFDWDGGAGPISLTLDGEPQGEIFARRAFPRGNPARYVQLYKTKEDGARADMIGMIGDLGDLPQQNRLAIAEAIRRSYLVPEVVAVLDFKDGRHVTRWTLDTDRGERTFDLIQPHRNVILTSSGRVILIDIEENRYEIPDIHTLDARSRHFLNQVV